MLISSRKNPLIQRYRSLCRERAFRKEQGCFPCEGAKLCEEAADAGLILGENAFVTPTAMEKYPNVVQKLSMKCNIISITEDISLYIADTKSPQGIFITVNSLDKILNLSTIYNSGSFLILENLQDMGNIGTIIRTCDSFGIDGIIASPECADIFSPKTARSTMGSVFRVPVYYCEMPEALDMLKQGGFTIYAAMLDISAKKLGSFQFPQKTAVVIGNEGNGISQQTALKCDERLFIPMHRAESLNASVAASLIAWEIRRSVLINK